MGFEPASVRTSSVRPFTLSSMNISDNSRRIEIKLQISGASIGWGEKLHMTKGKITPELCFPLQQIAPIGL